MAIQTLKLQRQENTGVVYALPTDPDLTVRVKHGESLKTLNGVQTTNYSTEIIYGDVNPITLGDTSANDAVSIRLRVSAARESKARVSELLASLIAIVDTWDDEDVFIGFNPETAPSVGSA